MNKITILGGSGFLGSALANLFSKNGKIKVIIFDTKKNKLLRNQKFIKGNILNEKALSKAIKNLIMYLILRL